MSTYNVRDAFQVLQERGIARDKQEVRKWLNEGYIQAEPPVNRRVGWKIDQEALQSFITRFENGEFQELRKRRRLTKIHPFIESLSEETQAPAEQTDSAAPSSVFYLEEEVKALRQQVRSLRREMNDLKKVLGFPILAASSDAEQHPNS